MTMTEAGHDPATRTGLEIAIVGMAGRFPGARNVVEFWHNLRDGVESLTVFTDEELTARGVAPALLRQPGYVKSGRVVDGFDRFDAAFFGISPREAELIDPQQRLFLECAWEALEDAGYDPDRVPRRVSVYAGARMNGYLFNVYSNPAIANTVGDLQIQVANDKDYLATRVSYKLNLGGASVTVQTACSTALVAIHFAAQALLSGECDMALAGGVGVRVPELGYLYAEGDVNSPDGHIRAFDANAKGTVFGSGLGIVVLKRLEDALAAGDNVRAVVKGSAITNDGALKVGFTAPGIDGQARVVRAAQLAAEVAPDTISYIEAHGTGTPVGDPIEIAALTRAFREGTGENGFCAVGSVKTNIGHLGAAAGIASVIKTVLAMEQRLLPPSLFFDQPNPQIDFAASPFYVNDKLSEWPARNGSPRRAGVSAFGMGGTNAHVILEEAPERPPAAPSRPWQLLLLSARTPAALEVATANLADHLAANPSLDLGDVAYTLEVGRKAFDQRRAVVCRNIAEAADAADAVETLRTLPPERTATGASGGKERPVAFLFSGQGAQYPGMGADLYRAEPVYRAEIDRCSELLAPHLGFDLREVLDPAPGQAEAMAQRLARTAVTQPALFAVEYALARLWMSWGVTPSAMLGHSIGEYVAACLAGVFSLPGALALVAARGRLMQDLPAGAMLSVPLPEEEIEPWLGPHLSLAAINAPSRLVVSGPEDAVEALRRRLEEKKIAARRLHTSHAFHSAMMEPVLAPFARQLAALELQPPQIPYLSNVTGTWITAAQATDAGYWAQHLRQAVRFADGVRELCAEPDRLLLEVGPGNSLTTLAQRHPDRAPGQAVIPSLPHARDRQSALPFMLRARGQLWLHGAAIASAGLHSAERRRVPLPTYPFEGERFWIDAGDLSGFAAALGATGGKRQEIDDWFYLPSWKPSLPPEPEGEPAGPGSRWLLFLDGDDDNHGDGGGLGQRLAERLEAAGQSVTRVAAGERFARLGERSFAVTPGRREDHDALLKELVAGGEVPEVVLHLWSVGREQESSASPMQAVLADEARGFWSLLFLAQACGKQNLKAPLRLAVISNHLQRVAGEGFLCPGKATLLGPSRIIPLEYPHIRCASLDVLVPEAGSPADEELIDRLLGEVAGGLPDPIVAYRGRSRFLLGYESVRIGPAPTERLRFRQGGTYLITGGLGGLGLTFAHFLARDFQGRLALLGLSPLPPRDDWPDWLAQHDARNRVSEKIRKVQALEALGAEVLVLAVDIADAGQVELAVQQVLARFGELHGVIHAAGLAGGGVIQLKSPETAARVLAPKVRGTLALDAALAGLPLDFFVLCSSTIAVAGGLGQVDYCAANSFLDAFAQDRSLRGDARTVSINWGAWQEVGMAVATGLTGGPGEVSAASAAAGRQDIHPLLDRCLRETAEQTIYETDFSAARQWVLADHRILGRPALPGTSYLEMARAAFEDHASVFERQAGEAGVELRDVLFLSPLMLDEAETRPVQTTLEPDGERFAFRVASRRPEAGGTAAWQAHARGKVGPLAPSPSVRLDLEAIRRRCEREIDVTGPVMSDGAGVVYWGPRWQSLKRVHIGQGEGLALLELPAELAADLASFALHPALLDVATGLIGFLEEGTHLPISYQRLALHKPLAGRLYSYLRKRVEDGGGKETVAVDVTLVDDNGETLVEIERFVMKRVTEAAGAFLRSSAPSRAETAPPPLAEIAAETPSGAMEGHALRPVAGEGILSREGVEVLRRVLTRGRETPQVVASAKDLNALFAQVRALDRGSLMDRPDLARGPRATHPRPSLPTPYIAPRDAAESRLAEIFQNALGIQEVGVHDNFFDLGGDSIVGIQVVARANEAGLTLSPDQLFEHQTIAELAALIAPPAETPPAKAAPTFDTTEPGEPFADAGLQPGELDKVLAKLKEMSVGR
jgi:phthiocerol/phenolphthiocerol synthesis type-I polyketide synthase E